MMFKKSLAFFCSCLLVLTPVFPAAALTDGEDVLYAVKSTSGSTQDWGTIAPSSGTFTSTTQISPTGLGWPLGDIGSEPDPINGYAYTRQTNTGTSATDILAIKKSDGSTQWLGIGANSLVVGYDTKTNKLIYRVSENSSNTLKTYDTSTTATGTIGTFGGSSTSWQAGGIGAVDSYGRTAFQLRPAATSTLYKIDLDDGTETTVSISQYVTTIAWDSKEQKLYGLYDSNSNGAYRVAEINTSNGSLTNVGAADTVAGMSNYVQLIAPNDQRYYVQESASDIRVISLTDGSSLGTFSAPLRLMPPGAVVIGAASTDETVTFDIEAPDSKLIKLGANDVTYTGTNNSTGGVDIEAGTLTVASSSNLGSGAVSLEGGELEVSADATITNAISSTNDSSAIDTGTNTVAVSGTLSGSNAITKKGSGTLEITGTNNLTGDAKVQEGTLKVASAAKLGSGAVSLEGGELEVSADATITNAISSTNDSSAIDTGGQSITVSGALSGTGEINKVGDGTLTLTGSLNNSGGVDITAGTLVANGSGSMPVTVTSGVLQGAGTIGNLTSSSTIEPGNSIGTLNVSGAVTLNSGSVLVIELDAAGNNDKIVATGAVTAGGTLRVSPASGTYSSGQQYTIITGSSISGTFSTVTVLSCSATASVAYNSASIVLTFSGCSVNQPKNRETISSYVNDLSSGASGDLSTVITALNTLSGDTYNKALEALDHNTSGAIASVAQTQISSINNVIGQRVAATSGSDKVASLLGFMTSSPANDNLEGLSFEDRLKKMGAKGWWARGHGGAGDKKALKELGVNGYDYAFLGTTVGYDKQNGNNTDGMAFTIQQGAISSDNSEGDTDHTTISVSKYQSRKLAEGIETTLTGSFALTNVDSSRKVKFASIDRTATASYNSVALDGAAEYAYSPRQLFGAAHNLSLQGGLTLNFQEGFTESGANALNLKVDSNQTQVARAGLVDTIYWSGNEDRSSIPFLSIGIHASHHLGSTETKQRFVNQSSFTTKSDRKTNAYGEVGFGFLDNGDKDTEVSFVTKGKFSDKLTELSAMLQYTKKF